MSDRQHEGDQETAATCPECARPIKLERGYWTCFHCCLAWVERPAHRPHQPRIGRPS